MNICGLDFGTSNSTIGVVQNGTHTMVPLEQDADSEWQTTLPSALFFGFDDDQISFGRHATTRYTNGESGRLMRSMKSLLGSAFMGDKTQVKNRFYTYDEIVSFFVARLKQQAELFRGADSDELESVVIGRPVYFNDTDRELDQGAEEHLAAIARLAGFKEVSFQFEPIAAAMDYERDIQTEELALIIDIGGGTSDFTLIRLSPERHQQTDRQSDFLANHGVHIGGTDFDRQISIASVMPQFGMGMPMNNKPDLNMPGHYYFELATWHRIHLLYQREILLELSQLRLDFSNKQPIDRLLDLLKRKKGHQLAALVERAKIDLSSISTTSIDLASLFSRDNDLAPEPCTLTRDQLQTSLQRDMDKIFLSLDETLSQAGLTHNQVDTVFTTGGSTALPLVQACIDQVFPTARRVTGDLYNSVGSGLLVEACKRYR